MNILLCLEKSSDLLEAYSALFDTNPVSLGIIFIDNERNSMETISVALRTLINGKTTVSFFDTKDREDFFITISEEAKTLTPGDLFIAPIIRYRQIWKTANELPSGVKTVHLSETLSDSFGHIGYRLAYRGRSLRSWLTLPFTKVYAMRNKPDICYYPLAPERKNPFVKATCLARIPELPEEKALWLKKLSSGEKRPLLVSGFGYDHVKMAACLEIDKYIATSKNKEIIIDGIFHQLPFHISAEEVLLSRLATKVVGYTSTAITWAKRIDPKMEIVCYKSTNLDKIYGPLFSALAKISLAKIDIKVLPENPSMVIK